MKVFNLTDVETPSLKQHKLVEQTIAVGPHLLEPGKNCDVEPSRLDHIRAGLQQLVTVGALAVGDQPPAAYVVAKAKAPKRATPATPPPPPTLPAPEVKLPPPSRVPGSKKSRS